MENFNKYSIFMDGTASLEADNFLKSGEDELSFFGKVTLPPHTMAYQPQSVV